jgi:hypothetical protein
MRTLAAALFFLLTLSGCTKLHPLTPLVPEKSDETNPPLSLQVFLPSDKDLVPLKGWLPPTPAATQILVMVRITNTSNKIVVLPEFTYWNAGLEFTCSSGDARQPPFFRTYNGQIEWVFLKPHESVSSYDNFADQMAFLRAGHYIVEYQINVGYTYAPSMPLAPHDLYADAHYHRDHGVVKRGLLDVLVRPGQVFSGK